MADKAKIVIVAALSRKAHAIGRENGLLWHIPADMKRFKEKTASHPVIMGRKTFESIVAILGKPLPGRPNIVVTRNPEYTFPGAIIVSSLTEALSQAKELDADEIHIGGGTEIYKQALPFVDELFLTFVDDEPEGDAFFPDFEDEFIVVKTHDTQEHNGLTYQFVDYIRKQ